MHKLKDLSHLMARPGVRVQGITNRPSPSGEAIAVIGVPIEAVSILNMSMHPQKLSRLKKRQRGIVALKLAQEKLPRLPIRVRLTRYYGGRGKELDWHDNLRAAFKATADEIASAYGVADKDPRIDWTYDQQRSNSNQRSIQIFIVPV